MSARKPTNMTKQPKASGQLVEKVHGHSKMVLVIKWQETMLIEPPLYECCQWFHMQISVCKHAFCNILHQIWTIKNHLQLSSTNVCSLCKSMTEQNQVETNSSQIGDSAFHPSPLPWLQVPLCHCHTYIGEMCVYLHECHLLTSPLPSKVCDKGSRDQNITTVVMCPFFFSRCGENLWVSFSRWYLVATWGFGIYASF